MAIRVAVQLEPGAGAAGERNGTTLAAIVDVVTTEEFVAHVAARAGIAVSRAEAVARVVIAGLATYLSPGQRQLFADELPTALGAAALAPSDLALPLEQRVVAIGVTSGHARELIASVCRVLVESLSTEILEAVRESAPESVAEWLGSPGFESRPTTRMHRRRTLSEGRPGGERPLSEASPDRSAEGSPDIDRSLAGTHR